jgi:hypothetical protein
VIVVTPSTVIAIEPFAPNVPVPACAPESEYRMESRAMLSVAEEAHGHVAAVPAGRVRRLGERRGRHGRVDIGRHHGLRDALQLHSELRLDAQVGGRLLRPGRA